MNNALITLTALTTLLIGCVEPELITDRYPLVTTEQAAIWLTEHYNYTCTDLTIYGFENGQDEHGYYGYSVIVMDDEEPIIASYKAWAECIVEEEDFGHTGYQISFDPNNGWVQRYFCNDYILNCTEENFSHGSRENPDFDVYSLLI